MPNLHNDYLERPANGRDVTHAGLPVGFFIRTGLLLHFGKIEQVDMLANFVNLHRTPSQDRTGKGNPEEARFGFSGL
jgi:hypothetical protein